MDVPRGYVMGYIIPPYGVTDHFGQSATFLTGLPRLLLYACQYAVGLVHCMLLYLDPLLPEKTTQGCLLSKNTVTCFMPVPLLLRRLCQNGFGLAGLAG